MTKEEMYQEVNLAFDLFEKTKDIDTQSRYRVLRIWEDLMNREQIKKDMADKSAYAAKLGAFPIGGYHEPKNGA